MMTYQSVVPEPSYHEEPIVPDYFEQQMQLFDRLFQEPELFDNSAQMYALFRKHEALFESSQAEHLSLE